MLNALIIIAGTILIIFMLLMLGLELDKIRNSIDELTESINTNFANVFHVMENKE